MDARTVVDSTVLDVTDRGSDSIVDRVDGGNDAAVDTLSDVVADVPRDSSPDDAPSDVTGCGDGDPANCGGRGDRCAMGQGCCCGACIPFNTPVNCNGCGRLCALAHATSSCETGVCHVTACEPGYGDCDGDQSNGCETSLTNSPQHCGQCGTTCSGMTGTSGVCMNGRCACASGWGDCNAMGGCETPITTNANCGACGSPCPSGATCTAGRCVCPVGTTQCGTGMSSSCVNTNTDNNNCGVCGRTCALMGASANTCTGSHCNPVCQDGYANCDSNGWNGCEVNTDMDNGHCGSCVGPACGSGKYCSHGHCCRTGTVYCDLDCLTSCSCSITGALGTFTAYCDFPATCRDSGCVCPMSAVPTMATRDGQTHYSCPFM